MKKKAQAAPPPYWNQIKPKLQGSNLRPEIKEILNRFDGIVWELNPPPDAPNAVAYVSSNDANQNGKIDRIHMVLSNLPTSVSEDQMDQLIDQIAHTLVHEYGHIQDFNPDLENPFPGGEGVAEQAEGSFQLAASNLFKYLDKNGLKKEAMMTLRLFKKYAAMRIELPEKKQNEIKKLFEKAKAKAESTLSPEMIENLATFLESEEFYSSGVNLLLSFGSDAISLITYEYKGNIEISMDKFKFIKQDKFSPFNSNRQFISRIRRDILDHLKNDEEDSFMKEIYKSGGFAKMRTGLIPDVLADGYLIEDSDIEIEDYGPSMTKESLISAKLQGTLSRYGLAIQKIMDLSVGDRDTFVGDDLVSKELSFKIAVSINDESLALGEPTDLSQENIRGLIARKEKFPENYKYIDEENYKDEITKFYLLDNILDNLDYAIRKSDVLSSQNKSYQPSFGGARVSKFDGIITPGEFTHNSMFPRNKAKSQKNADAFEKKMKMYKDNYFVIPVTIHAPFYK